MKYILLMFLPMLLFGQNRFFSETLFPAATDTVSSTTSPDTLDWRGYISGADATAWNEVTDYISAAEKAAGVSLSYKLSGETGWTWFQGLELRIRSQADTITTNIFSIGGINGAVTVFIDPDTSLSYGDYSRSKIGGN